MSTVVLSSPSEAIYSAKPLTSMRSRNMRPYPVHPNGAIVAKLSGKSYRVVAIFSGNCEERGSGGVGMPKAALRGIPVAEPEVAGTGLTFAMIQGQLLCRLKERGPSLPTNLPPICDRRMTAGCATGLASAKRLPEAVAKVGLGRKPH